MSCLTWICFVDPHWWVPLCVQRPAKAMPFQQIIIHALDDVYVHLLFCFDLDLHITCSQGPPEFVFNFDWFLPSIFTDGYHFACSAQQKLCLFNKLSYIAMPTWPRCAPSILCWPWPPYNLLPRSCLTWIFFVDPHWWVSLCVVFNLDLFRRSSLMGTTLHFACSAQQKLCLFNKLSYMHCNANMT